MRYVYNWEDDDDLDQWEDEFDSSERRYSDDGWLFPWPRFRFLCPWRRR